MDIPQAIEKLNNLSEDLKQLSGKLEEIDPRRAMETLESLNSNLGRVDAEDALGQIKEFNKNLEKVDVDTLVYEIRRLNNLLESMDVGTIERFADILSQVDLKSLQENLSTVNMLVQQFSEEEEKVETKG